MGLRGSIGKGRIGKHLQGAKIGIKCKSMLTGRPPGMRGVGYGFLYGITTEI